MSATITELQKVFNSLKVAKNLLAEALEEDAQNTELHKAHRDER